MSRTPTCEVCICYVLKQNVCIQLIKGLANKSYLINFCLSSLEISFNFLFIFYCHCHIYFSFVKDGPQLLKSQACRSGISCLMRPDALAKTYKLSPISASAVPEYFRARRGPFTPGILFPTK